MYLFFTIATKSIFSNNRSDIPASKKSMLLMNQKSLSQRHPYHRSKPSNRIPENPISNGSNLIQWSQPLQYLRLSENSKIQHRSIPIPVPPIPRHARNFFNLQNIDLRSSVTVVYHVLTRNPVAPSSSTRSLGATTGRTEPVNVVGGLRPANGKGKGRKKARWTGEQREKRIDRELARARHRP